MADRIQFRRDTAARWAQYNPILLEGEVGYVTDNPNQYKLGDGISTWDQLPLRGFTGTISQETGDDENAVMSQKATTEKFTELEKYVQSEDITNSLELSGKIIYSNGTISESDIYKTSSPILLKQGEKISVSTYGYDKSTKNISIITEVDASGNFIRCLVANTYTSDNGFATKFSYLAKKNIYITVSFSASNVYRVEKSVVYSNEVKSSEFKLFQGKVDSNGDVVSAETAITSGFLKSPFNIEVNDGYVISDILKYDSEFKLISNTTSEIFAYNPSDDYYYRLTFSKIDGSSSDIYDTITKSFSQGVNFVDKTSYKLQREDDLGYNTIIEGIDNFPHYGDSTNFGKNLKNTGFIPINNATVIDYSCAIGGGDVVIWYNDNYNRISSITDLQGVILKKNFPSNASFVKIVSRSRYAEEYDENAYVKVYRNGIYSQLNIEQGAYIAVEGSDYGKPDIPPISTRVRCLSYFNPASIITIDVPEGIYVGYFMYDRNKQAIGYVSASNNIDVSSIEASYIRLYFKYPDDSVIHPNDESVKKIYIITKENVTDYNINNVILLERGCLSDNGDYNISDEDNFMTKWRTGKPIIANGTYTFSEDCTIYEFDDNYNLITTKDYTSGDLYFPDCFVFKLESTSNIISCVSSQEIIYSKNHIVKNKIVNTLVGITIRDYATNTAVDTLTKCKILCPDNYNINGTPIRLILFATGSGGNGWNITTMTSYEQMQFLNKEGYLVVHVNGLTKYFHDKYPSVDDDLATPNAVSCYKQIYDWIYANFNIYRECFLFGKSLGGSLSGMLQYTSGIPILASAGLAPIFDVIGEVLRNRTAKYVRYYLEAFGIDSSSLTDDELKNLSTDKAKQLIINNANTFIGFNAIWCGCVGLDPVALLTETFKHSIWGGPYPSEEELYTSLPKLNYVPYKVWIAEDDVNVDPRLCRYVKTMSVKGSGIYELRIMPSGTGGHWAVDTGIDGNPGSETFGQQFPILTSTVNTKYGGSVNIATAYAEMVSFFRQFE